MNVLIVEDERDIRDSLKMALEFEGHQVSVASDGQEALHFLKRNHRPDLILLDLMMPVMNGWEFQREISKTPTLSRIPLIVVSAFAEHSLTIPAAAVLKKPLDLEGLLRTIDQHGQPEKSPA